MESNTQLLTLEVKTEPNQEINQLVNENEDTSLLGDSHTKRDKYELVEPITHIRNKTFFEKLVSSCINQRRTMLSLAELRVYYKLKIEANTLFEFENEDHNNIVRELWFILDGQKLEEIKNNGWKLFGFQNIDPRTDFRGGGILSLINLISYSKNYRNEISEMTKETTDFLFGVTSINVTYYLIKYYHLADYLNYDKDKADICSRKALKTFCSLLLDDENVIHKIHDMLLTDVFHLWLLYKKTWTDATIMEFKSAIDEIIEKYVKATKDTIYYDFDSIKRRYLGLPNNFTRRVLK